MQLLITYCFAWERGITQWLPHSIWQPFHNTTSVIPRLKQVPASVRGERYQITRVEPTCLWPGYHNLMAILYLRQKYVVH